MKISKDIVGKLNNKEEVDIVIHPIVQKEFLPNMAHILKNNIPENLINYNYEITLKNGKKLFVKLFPLEVLDMSKYSKNEMHIFINENNEDKIYFYDSTESLMRKEKHEYGKLKRIV